MGMVDLAFSEKSPMMECSNVNCRLTKNEMSGHVEIKRSKLPDVDARIGRLGNTGISKTIDVPCKLIFEGSSEE